MAFDEAIPFQALNGVSIPSSASGQLDLVRTTTMLSSLARWWIVDNIDAYQGNTLLSKPQVTAARISLPSIAGETTRASAGRRQGLAFAPASTVEARPATARPRDRPGDRYTGA